MNNENIRKPRLELFSENTEKRIKNYIKEVEKGTSRRRLVPEHLDEIIKAIKETRAGAAHACGGSIVKGQQYPAKTTYFVAVWYTLRKKKFIKYYAARVKTTEIENMLPLSGEPFYSIDTDSNAVEFAYYNIFTRRYYRYLDLENRRSLRKEGFNDPSEKILIVKSVIDKEYKLAIITYIEKDKFKTFKLDPIYLSKLALLTASGFIVEYPPFYKINGPHVKRVVTPAEAYEAITGKPILEGGYKTLEEIVNELLVSVLLK